MALQKTPIPVNFSQGVQTKADPFQIPIGQFASLRNTIFTKDGLQQKRNGYGLLLDSPTGAQTLATLNQGLVILGDRCSSYNASSREVTDAGLFQPLEMDTVSMVRRATSQLTCDTAVSTTGLACTTWLDADGSSYYQISDSETGQIVVPTTALRTTATMSRVFLVGNFFIITYLATVSADSHFQYICVPVMNPTNPGSPVDISSQANGLSAAYDGTVFSNSIYLSLDCDDGGGAIRTWRITASNASAGSVGVPSVVVASAELLTIKVNNNTGFPIIWVNYFDTDTVYAFALNSNFTVNLAPTPITTALTDGIEELTCDFDGSDLVSIYERYNQYDYTPAAPEATDIKTDFIAKNTLTLAGVAGTEEAVLRGVGLASKAIMSTVLNKIVILSTYGQAFQPTYFLIDLDGNVLARLAYSNGKGYLTNQVMPNINQDSNGVLRVAYLYADQLLAVNREQGDAASGVYAQLGINLAKIELTGVTQALEIGGSSHVSGGMLWQYDGVKIREHGFNVWPEDIGVIGEPYEVQGHLSAAQGEIFYQVTYEWTDAAGQIHRSAPSVPISYTILTPPANFTATTVNGSATLSIISAFTNLQVGQILSGTGIPVGTYIAEIHSTTITMSANATASNSGVTITPSAVNTTRLNIPTLRQTYKTDNKVRIVIYRWSTTQQTYFRITSITDPLLNDTSVDSVIYRDVKSDASIIGNDILYTNGGVIENIVAPGSNAMTLWQSRLFMVDTENRNLIWFSKQVIEATPVEMSDALTLYVAPTTGAQGSTGPISALSSMDDKLIIFKEDAIYYITGQGPDITGANNQYSDPVFITGTVGCLNPKSIVLTPQGIMFQSDKGIWMLGRDLSTTYKGAPVEGFTQGNLVTSALCAPGTNQVRFTLDNNTAVMYDYFYDRWANWNQMNAISSVIYEGVQTYLSGYETILVETPNQYLDVSTPVLLGLTTGWINLAGVQGFERFYHAYLLGVFITPFKLNVQLAYDYNPSAIQNIIITPDNYTKNWGEEANWGAGGPWGGPGNKFSARFFPKKQKCQSFQITIEEVFDPSYGTIPGAGLTLSGMNLIVGSKRGSRTQSAKNSFG